MLSHKEGCSGTEDMFERWLLGSARSVGALVLHVSASHARAYSGERFVLHPPSIDSLDECVSVL